MRASRGATKGEVQSSYFTSQDVIGHTFHGLSLGAVLLVLLKATSLKTTTAPVSDPV
jgi:hypothetical protein